MMQTETGGRDWYQWFSPVEQQSSLQAVTAELRWRRQDARAAQARADLEIAHLRGRVAQGEKMLEMIFRAQPLFPPPPMIVSYDGKIDLGEIQR